MIQIGRSGQTENYWLPERCDVTLPCLLMQMERTCCIVLLSRFLTRFDILL